MAYALLIFFTSLHIAYYGNGIWLSYVLSTTVRAFFFISLTVEPKESKIFIWLVVFSLYTEIRQERTQIVGYLYIAFVIIVKPFSLVAVNSLHKCCKRGRYKSLSLWFASFVFRKYLPYFTWLSWELIKLQVKASKQSCREYINE